MFGFIQKNALKAIAHKVLRDLILCRSKDDPERGMSIEEIMAKTGLNSISTVKMLVKLMEMGLIEEFHYSDKPHYRAINIPKHIDETAERNLIFAYVRTSLIRAKFD